MKNNKMIILLSSIHIVNLGTLSYGIAAGWMAISYEKYESDNCPLPSGRVQTHEIGWLASILGIGGLIGTVASGWMADRFGRKNSLIVLAVPQIVSIYIQITEMELCVSADVTWITLIDL